MAFDSEKWTLEFYGVVNEQFQVETDMFKLHIHRKSGIEKLDTQKGEGTLDIYIPHKWNIEEYLYQEKLRKLLFSEVKKQAQRIFTSRTMHYANRYGIQCERVEMSTRGHHMGFCYADYGLIRYNPWLICTASKNFIDYLVCHELAHFFHHGHGSEFWKMAERLYLGLGLTAHTSGQTIRKMENDFVHNKMLNLLKFWGQPSYLKAFYRNGSVKRREPLIIPNYIDVNGKQVEYAYFTTFKIRI